MNTVYSRLSLVRTLRDRRSLFVLTGILSIKKALKGNETVFVLLTRVLYKKHIPGNEFSFFICIDRLSVSISLKSVIRIVW